MIKKPPFVFGVSFLSLFLTLTEADAKTQYAIRGYLSAQADRYTNNDNQEKNGQSHRAQFEQDANVDEHLSFVNQLRWSYSSLYTDLAKNEPTDPKDTHKIYLGDNYIKYKAASWVMQAGYQEVAWGEAFGFNYADIINPKDLKKTFYSDYSESRLPLFLVNYKYFFNAGSFQLIYSPEPRFSESLPVSLFTKNILTQTNVVSYREATPKFFKEHEYGGKLSTSFMGLDASLFYFSYLDRDPAYILKSASLDGVVLQEDHERVNSTGISLAKTLMDNYVFRTDVVYTKNKHINSISGFSLLNTPVNMMNVLVSLDTPTYKKFSGVFIFANSSLSEKLDQAFREKNQSYGIAKMSYDFGEDKIFDLSYTHEFSKSGHALQSLLTWPITGTLDLRIGAEMYWGKETSELYKIKNVSNVFFGIKNYFQL